jgi:hypothetical protein
VRRVAETLLGLLDLSVIAVEKPPTVADILSIISELRHLKIATRKRFTGQDNEILHNDMEDDRWRSAL